MWRRRLTVPEAAKIRQDLSKRFEGGLLTNSTDLVGKSVANQLGSDGGGRPVALKADEVGNSTSDVGSGLYYKH